MGDANTVLNAAAARHLLKRTGFGATPAAVAKILKGGDTRGEAVDRVLKFTPKKFQPGGKGKDPSLQDSHDKWINFMLAAKFPLQEKLVLFWHDHFATSNVKVADTAQMAEQNLLLRLFCKGTFRDFVKAINKNPAMLEFLDTVRSGRRHPNENYARELMELFTLGVLDTAGNPNYLQDDIVQIARAFSGWRYDDKKRTAFLDSDHHDFMADFPERGPKTIFTVRGGFGASGRSFAANGEGAAEIDTVIDILFTHTDTDEKNTIARRMARRLLEYFAHPEPDIAVIDAVVAASSFDASWDVGALLRAILVHDAFYETAAPPPFDGATKKSVLWPVDYVVSTLRVLGVKPTANKRGDDLRVVGSDSIRGSLTDMGQSLFEPPSVFGWDWEAAWISSATLLARFAFVRGVVGARVKGKSGFHPEKLIDLTLTDPGAIVDAVTDLLGVDDQLTSAERDVLIAYLTDDGAQPVIDLTDADVQNVKLHGLFALVLESPAYQLH